MSGISFSRRTCAVALGCFVLACAGVAARAEQQQNGIEIENAWIRPASKASPATMAFFEIVNHSDRTERLLSVTSPAGEARLNALHMQGSNASVAELKSIVIPPSGRVVLKPGGSYVTLREAANALRVGRSVTLSLRFENAGNMDISAEVVNQLLGNRR